MPTYQGRVEALIKVPAGGAACSAALGAIASPVTVTVPEGSYYHTAAGGRSSLLTTLETQLNDNVQGYPQTGAAMQQATGSPLPWSAGYLCNEASGNLVPVFGSPTLTASGSPVYGITGPRAGIDKAVGFDSTTDQFAGGAGDFDVALADDLVIGWVGYFTGVPGTEFLVVKRNAGGATGYTLSTGGATLNFATNSASGSVTASLNLSATYYGVWHVGLAVIERATNKIRVGIRTLSGTTNAPAEVTTFAETMSTADPFTFGNRQSVNPALSWRCSALYMAKGAGVATGLSTNLSTALTNFANAINAAWSVSRSSTDGRITIANSFWPSYVTFTNTALRDVLGYEYDIDYPQTAAQLAAALGYGTWTSGAGYLCNESGGNLASVFGTPATLTAVSSPTYSNPGPRGAVDKAVGFDSVNDGFNGGDVFDAALADLAIVMVAKISNTSNVDLCGRGWPTSAWVLVNESAGGLKMYVNDGTTTVSSSITGMPTGQWLVIVAAVDRTANTLRVGYQSLVTGTQGLGNSASIAALGTLTGAGNFTIGDSNAYNETAASLQIAAVYVTQGSGVASGINANLSAALANIATYMKSQTGTQQARGVWFPDCPLMLNGDPTQAPRISDLRTSQSPTGVVLGLAGNTFYRHTGLVYSHVPRPQVWDSAATYENGSWEEFFYETQMGMGSSWFTPATPVQVYYQSGASTALLGGDFNGTGVSGWTITGLDAIEPKKAIDQWSGLFRIELGTLVSSG